MIAQVKRQCSYEVCWHPHYWEWLNPLNMLPFKRGRTVFFCRGGPR
jgi:hypothetical protein